MFSSEKPSSKVKLACDLLCLYKSFSWNSVAKIDMIRVLDDGLKVKSNFAFKLFGLEYLVSSKLPICAWIHRGYA